MDKNMLDRLNASENRVKEIDELLSDPSITNDLKKFKELSKERSYLEPIVEKFLEYKSNKSNMEDALIMSNDSDPEISLMGKEEYKNSEENIIKIEEEIKVFLLQKE